MMEWNGMEYGVSMCIVQIKKIIEYHLLNSLEIKKTENWTLVKGTKAVCPTSYCTALHYTALN